MSRYRSVRLSRGLATILGLTACALLLGVVVAFQPGAAAQAPPAAAPGAVPPPQRTGPPPKPPTHDQKAEEYFKNIKVLTGVPADEVIPAMQFMSASLGVDCEHCHVERANEKDDKKEKETARKMISMVMAVNRDSFAGKREVTCNSCHRGAVRPAAAPAVAEAASTMAPERGGAEAKPADLPAADAVLDKYLQAVGGAGALEKITSRVQKGKMTGFGPAEMPVEVYAQAPDRRVSIVHTPRGDSITAYDGKTGWLGNAGRPPRDMSSPESEAARLDADMRLPARIKQMFKEIKIAPQEKIDGRDTNHLVGVNDGKPPVEFWFDAQSGLLVRMMRYSETPLGRNPTRIDYADYRDEDGVKIPFRWAVSRPGSRFEISVDETLQNVPIESTRFEKPASS
jgi:photosynthetic reaction center cytochrome c subunit